MAIKTEIQELLETRWSYSKAHSLYCQYGPNEFLKKLLAKPSNFNEEKLRAELKKLYQEAQSTPEPENIAEKKTYPKEVEAIIQERKQAFRNAMRYREVIPRLEDKEKRKHACLEVKRLMKENARLWALEDYYNKNNKLPEPPRPQTVTEGLSISQLITKRNNCRANITKNRKRNNMPKVREWEETLKTIESRITELENEEVING